ncbi:MAG: hypothetical protein ACMXYM_03850 [Candidatus Woesearchaeota archaeon]
MLESVLAIGGDVAVLRVAVLFFVFVLVYSLLTKSSVERKSAVMLSVVVSLIAVLGFSNEVIVAIMTGYSGVGLAILFLLPIILLLVVIFWKSESLGVSFIKLISAVLVLGFVRIVSDAIDSFNANVVLGFDIDGVVGLIVFVLYVVIFFFGFDVLSKLFVGSQRS